MNDVGQELMQQKGSTPNFKLLGLRPSNTWRPTEEFMQELVKPPTVAQKFSVGEIEDKLKKAFNTRDLKGTRFEFGISSDVNLITYEIRSANFLNAVEDTLHNLQAIYLLQVSGGTELDNLVPAETLTVIVPNYNSIVIKQMYWREIRRRYFFHADDHHGFLYITVWNLLKQKAQRDQE